MPFGHDVFFGSLECASACSLIFSNSSFVLSVMHILLGQVAAAEACCESFDGIQSRELRRVHVLDTGITQILDVGKQNVRLVLPSDEALFDHVLLATEAVFKAMDVEPKLVLFYVLALCYHERTRRDKQENM